MTLRNTLVFILLIASSLCAQSVYVPLEHRVYDFFDRMETRGILHHIRGGSRPFTRERCAGILRNLDRRVNTDPEAFSSVEKQTIERMKGEFWAELRNEDVAVRSEEKEPHFYVGDFTHGRVAVDALIGYGFTGRTPDAPESEHRIHNAYYGAALRGRVYGVGFYSDNRIFSEWGSRTYRQHYDASEGYPQSINRDSSRAVWDASDSYIAFGVRGVRVQWGRDKVGWGPIRGGGLMLSGLAPSFDLIKLHFDLGPSTFTWLHGELRSDFSHKWIAAHRLELSLSKSLDVGLQEVVIYGRRGVETAYLNPMLPYLVAEHTLGDRDNVSIGLDFDFRTVRNLKFTGELFIDDLFAPWEILNDFWGNKLAFGLGADWADPFGLRDSHLVFEYVRIEPYVYTHEDSVNVFEHYASGLGRSMHPNSDRVGVEAGHRFSLEFQAAATFSIQRHGRGDRRIPHRPEDGETKSFLGGTVERVIRSGLDMRWEPVRDLWVLASGCCCTVRNAALQSRQDRQWIEGALSVHWNW